MAIETYIFVFGVAFTAVFGMNNEHMLFVKVANFTIIFSPEIHERCREEFSDVRTLNICISFVGNYDMFEGRKQCSSRNASIINIRSDEELELLKRLMENQGNKPFIQGQWNGSHWVLDDGKPMECTTLPVKSFSSGDCLKFNLDTMQIAVSKCSRRRPVVCAYAII